MAVEHPLALIFGILGNVVSCMVYLAPLPTFYRIVKKKNTEGFQAVPYVVALFSATLWILYSTLKPNGLLLITINTTGCVVESVYIIVFIIYAPRKVQMKTIALILLLNVGAFSVVLLVCQLFFKGQNRLRFMGWVCTVFAVSVSAAPLSVMRLVIRTRSVEFMPFPLSFFLTLSTVVWFVYGLLIKDLFVALPNVVGFTLGTLQMLLYVVCMNRKRGGSNKSDEHVPEPAERAVTLSTTIIVGGRSSVEVHPIEVREEADDLNSSVEVRVVVSEDNDGAKDTLRVIEKEEADQGKREGSGTDPWKLSGTN